MSPDPAQIRKLLTAYQAAPDPDTRNALLDELQDAVGLAGRMVMDDDILRKAKHLVGMT